ncbi:unnamed protein product [Rodentolepis nana]|uniref:PHD-type domain-containing protein n=1 Tax=Rodentolepis nana TaxID=102285 RepID=A0A0R3TZG0_RODNA|nr:unnamed protein product [Rodentolepis nana]
MLCLEHYQNCTCCPPEKQILIYRYDLDELKQISQRPQARIREYHEWKARVDDFLLIANSLPRVEIKKEVVGEDTKEEFEKETSNGKVHQSAPSEANIAVEPITIKAELEEIPPVSRISLQELIDLRDKGLRNVYPDNLIDALSAVITEVEEYATTVRSICHLKLDEKEASGDMKPSGSFAADSSPSEQMKSSPKKLKKESPEWSSQDIVQPDLPLNPDLAKLSLREFELFVEKVNKLPCEFPEMEELNLLKRRIEEWQVSAFEVLTLSSQIVQSEKEEDTDLARPLPPLPELQRVEDLVNFGRNIEVDLKPLLPLRYVLECLSWLNTIESIMNLLDGEASSEGGLGCDKRPTLKYLLDTEARGQRLTFYLLNYAAEDMKGGTAQQGDSTADTTIALEMAVSRYNRRLLAAINATQILEASMKKFLKAPHGSCHLLEAEKLVERTGNVLGTFSAAEELSAMCTKARSIMDHLNAFQRIIELNRVHRERSTEVDMHPGYATRKPSRADARIKLPEEFVQRIKLNTPESTPKLWLEFYNELCRGAKRLPFIFPDTSRIKKLLVVASRCYERLKAAFMPFEDESEFNVERFLEAALPRPKAALAILMYRDIEHFPSAQSLASDPGDCSSQAYAEACRRNVKVFMEQLNTGRSFDNLYDIVYSSMIDDELKLLHYLRKINNRKSKHRDQDSVFYCVCRQPGYSGFMLQCELCRDWFHKRCVGFSSKNVDVSRLRYVCPHCERTNRPELAEVILILKELVPHFLGQEDEDNEVTPPYRLGDWSKSVENIGSELTSVLSSIPLLLKFPFLTAVHLACERAFIFARRVKEVIDRRRDLWELLREYEAFSGVKIQWQNYNEAAILASTRSTRHQHHQQRGQAMGSSLSRSHLPPNVTRPPGMQPLVLRTSAPRSLVTSEERLQQLRHQQQQQQFGEKVYQQ